MTTDALEIAWLAGLLEGEGCFTVSFPKKLTCRPYFRVCLKMTDRDVVVRAREIIGSDCTIQKKEHSNDLWNTAWAIEVNGKTAERVARTVRPFMGDRRTARIDEILAMDLSHRPRSKSD